MLPPVIKKTFQILVFISVILLTGQIQIGKRTLAEIFHISVKSGLVWSVDQLRKSSPFVNTAGDSFLADWLKDFSEWLGPTSQVKKPVVMNSSKPEPKAPPKVAAKKEFKIKTVEEPEQQISKAPYEEDMDREALYILLQ